MSANDIERERRIDILLRAMLRTPSMVIKRVLWEKAAAEIRSRSPEQVARMEQGRGLA